MSSSSSSSGLNLDKFLIPLKEIKRATQNFSSETEMGYCGYGKVYRGQLSERWQNCDAVIKRRDPECDEGKVEFFNERKLMSSFHHENIIPFIGYCDEEDEMIIVTENAFNGSLNYHLMDQNRRRFLTWAKRLKICLGIARGLEYLQSGLGERGKVIQREPNSANILLDENMEPKICNFGLSVIISRKLPHVYSLAEGIDSYMDPVYRESGIVNAKTDTYAFGVVLFEMLSGMLAYDEKSFEEDGKPQLLIQAVRRYYDVGLERLIDPGIREDIDRLSLNMVKEIAYKCISFNLKERPTFNLIIKTIDRALEIHNHRAASIVVLGSLHQNTNLFRIPLEEIEQATRNFSSETLIGDGKFGGVYKGRLSKRWQNRNAAFKRRESLDILGKEEFLNELELICNFRHENIIPFIGYCDEDFEMIIVTEYAVNGSLDYHLKDPNKRRFLTWAQRLKICLGVATGLKYLHSGLGERGKVIQREPNSGNILLDENMEAKLCDFGLSILIPKNQTHVYAAPAGIRHYIDPVYQESGFLKTETDVYGYGVVLFELLTGTLAYEEARNLKDVKEQLRLINLVRRYYDDEPDILVDPLIKDQVDNQSLHAFTDLAYECISFDIKERPSMDKIIKRIQELIDFQNRTITAIPYQKNQNLEDFLIPLEEIKKAIGGDFIMETRAGDGGFGVVYKGQLSERWQNRTVAIKRLKPNEYDGNKEFLNELKLIFTFQHENIIPFIGYCDEGNEMIIVTEYAINGSLDCYLENEEKRRGLTWTQRLKICLGAARGLKHLHSGHGKLNTVIHRDIKSANILLDVNMEAKICDFGLSKLDLINQSHTGVYTKQAGTNFYMDPIYHESGKLRTKSDVYSFGIVMFEMLSGMMAYNYKNFGDGKPQFLVSLVRRYYVAGGVEMLMDPLIKDQPCDARSFDTFQDTAYECINMNYKERPTMDTVIDRIEEALGYQASLCI